MAGFNVPTRITPERLAQIAAASFRPPPSMAMPSMNMPAPPPPKPGFNVGESLSALAAALGTSGGIKDVILNATGSTAGDADLAGYGSSPPDPMSGNPNAQPVEVFNPTGAASGGGFVDFLTGLFKPRGTQMASFVDPSVARATNPYLSPPQAPDKGSTLGNLLLGAGVGISQAAGSGRGWASGIAPGLMMGAQLANNAQRQSEEMAMRRAQYAMMLDRLRTQGAR